MKNMRQKPLQVKTVCIPVIYRALLPEQKMLYWKNQFYGEMILWEKCKQSLRQPDAGNKT